MQRRTAGVGCEALGARRGWQAQETRCRVRGGGSMPMGCRIVEESVACLADYARIPIRFEVRSLFEIEGDDLMDVLHRRL